MGGPTNLRRILSSAAVALVCGVGVLTLIVGFSPQPGIRTVQLLTVVVLGGAIVTSVIVLTLVHFADWGSPASEDDFEAVVRRVERLAGDASWASANGAAAEEDVRGEVDLGVFDPAQDDRFSALVRAAVNQLPLEFHVALEHVAIVVADGGARVKTGGGRRGAYGLYQGDTVVQDHFHDRIVIFRDTLVRDFGHDPELLQEQVTRTVRHELAHHLGWNERGVSDLGL